MPPLSSAIWATVLAGGTGRRLAGLTRGIPKQFWGFAEGGTLLEATLGRLAPLAHPKLTSIVVDETHEPYVRRLDALHPASRVLYQPCECGTAAGVLFGLLPALESGANKIVLVTPSDHGVMDTCGFRCSIQDAVARVKQRRQRFVLFGAEPNGDDGDYGWIVAAAADGGGDGAVRRVAGFAEKPPFPVAAQRQASGAALNTMVFVTTTAHLLDLYRRHLPDLARVFDEALAAPPGARMTLIADAYAHLPRADFCADLLSHADDLWVRVWGADLGWSDLGTPGRLRTWLTRAAHVPGTPALPTAAASAASA